MADIIIPYEPNPKQYLFHACPAEEAVYGGAKGGGKSKALVMETLAYALEYSGAICGLFRETYPNLEANLIREWKKSVPKELYRYNESKHLASLPNGSQVLFRYVKNEKDAESYQGQEFDFIGVDELTKHTERTIQLLLSCLRSAKGFPPRFRGTCNPGGKGHGHVKRNFVEATDYGKEVVRDIITGNRRVFIPANVYDNHVLMANDPAYAKRLENLPEQERKAFLFGDWNVFIGQVFSEWNRQIHVIDPFEIPASWMRFRAMDWGFARPFCIGWYAVDYDGLLYRYREYYGMKPNQPNVGVELDPYEVARKVKQLEAGENISYGVADPSCWAKDKRFKIYGNGGETVAETFIKEGVYWQPADNDRLPGKMQIHMRLRGHGQDRPGVRIFSTCKHLIRTLPELCYSETDPEDVDTDMEDHPYDEFRYACQSRPWTPVHEKQKPRDAWDYDDEEGSTSYMAG
ncbi:conserved hypothetical protein [uncultured Sporomusa sp.]|uniref:Uncharacterized protein n=1 Tax=uncultured Sporomusa sp. TaxID=307249 RepID=A0A212LY11_9FIRM|nr:phage terminase large subunit [uncultured Sporomusa sp.]SCM82396.1 conserved hypothetical protein [uncultured Sporomusa sp.]